MKLFIFVMCGKHRRQILYENNKKSNKMVISLEKTFKETL